MLGGASMVVGLRQNSMKVTDAAPCLPSSSGSCEALFVHSLSKSRAVGAKVGDCTALIDW